MDVTDRGEVAHHKEGGEGGVKQKPHPLLEGGAGAGAGGEGGEGGVGGGVWEKQPETTLSLTVIKISLQKQRWSVSLGRCIASLTRRSTWLS